MEKELEKSLEDFIVSRCVVAIKESEEYERLQTDNCSQEEVLDAALLIGYKKGASDMIKVLLNCSQKL